MIYTPQRDERREVKHKTKLTLHTAHEHDTRHDAPAHRLATRSPPVGLPVSARV